MPKSNYYLNIDQSQPTFLGLGDSFFHYGVLHRLLAENCSKMTGIWSYALTDELLNIIKPNVVLFEMTERALNTMGAQTSPFFQSLVTIQQDGSYMDIYFSDYGVYP